MWVRSHIGTQGTAGIEPASQRVVRHLDRDESGTSLVIVTICMVVLMGFAAVAVDLAHAWSQVRQDQSAADTGGIAGAIFTAEKPRALAIADAAGEVIRISKESLDIQLSDAQWAAEWAACTDPSRPPSYTSASAASPCISFTDNLERMRVKLPDIHVATSFGNVIGVDTIATSAAAEIQLVFAASGGAMPFGLPGEAAGDTEICLKTGPNPNGVPPCDGPATGNFGFLDITQFGSSVYGTATQCTGGTTTRLARNIAQGVDHPLGTATGPTALHFTDRTGCNDGNYNVRPYTLTTETGNMAQALHDGFVDGVGGVPGRLTSSSTTVAIAGNQIDDTPLWDYLNMAGEGLCGTVNSHDVMADCLANVWTPADGVIFEPSIVDAARFGWVPLFWDLTLGSGTTDLNIREFRPVFIQTTFWKCNAASCRFIHDPDEPLGGTGGGGGGVRIEASTAIQIPREALDDSITSVGPGTPGQVVYTIVE